MQRFSRPYHNKSKKTFGKERQIFIFTLYYQSSIHHHATVYYFVLCLQVFCTLYRKIDATKKKIVTKITKKRLRLGEFIILWIIQKKRKKRTLPTPCLNTYFT